MTAKERYSHAKVELALLEKPQNPGKSRSIAAKLQIEGPTYRQNLRS